MSVVNLYVNRPTLQVSINVDVSSKLKNFGSELKKRLPGTIRRIALEGKSFWKSEAGRKLKSSRKVYQNSIKMDMTGNTSFSLRLEGFLACSVEVGNPKKFDMKPGFLRNPSTKKRKFPATLRDQLRQKAPYTMYRIIPLNVNRYISMQKPTVFRTVHDQSPKNSWMHPGWKGVNISKAVVAELKKNIIPKHIKEMMKGL